MEREQMQRCLDVVAAYRASGQKGKVWAQANGVRFAARAGRLLRSPVARAALAPIAMA